MMNPGSKIGANAGAWRQQVGFDPRPMPQRKDPNQLTPDVQPSDLIQEPYDPTRKQKKILEDFNKEFKEDHDAQKRHHSEWFTAWSMYVGEQWRAWSRAQNRFLDTHPGPGEIGYDVSRRFRSYNKIKPLIDKTKSKILQNDPNAIVAPRTANDINAAREFRSVVSHLQSINDIESLSDELTDWCLQTATPCLKVYWDPTKSACLPIIGANGQMVSSVDKENMGDIAWEIVSPFEWLADNKAKRWNMQRRMWHMQVVPLQYVQERFKDGWLVKPDAYVGDESGVEARMAMIVGDAPRSGFNAGPDGCLLKEKWERKSPAYPKGRYIVIAGEIVLAYAEEWPNGDGETFPFVPYYYKKRTGTVYGFNAVTPLKDGQILINKAIAKMEEWMDLSAYFVVAPKGAEMGQDAFTRNVDRLMTTVMHRPGFKPDFEVTPPMSPNMGICAEVADEFMRDSIGVHDQTDGKTTAGVDTGVAIQLLQEADDTQIGPVRKLVANFWQQVLKITLPIAQKNYLEPRLLMMQDSVQADPNAAHSEVIMFQNLSAGRLVIAPGSTAPANPTLQAARIMDLMKYGALKPDTIATTIPLLNILLTENADKVTDDMLAAEQKMAAQQPSKADLLQQQMQMETMQMSLKNKMEIELQTAVEQLKTQREAELVALKGKEAMDLARLTAMFAEELQKIKDESALSLAALKGQLEQERDTAAQTQFRIQGNFTPIEVASIARDNGIDTPDDATLKKLTLAPTMPTGSSSTKPVGRTNYPSSQQKGKS